MQKYKVKNTSQLGDLENRLKEQEQYSRRTNLRFTNVPGPTSFTSESIQPVYPNKSILCICNMEHLSSLPVFSEVRVTGSLVLCVMFCRSLFVILSFFFQSLCCLSLFNVQILITPLASSNSSHPLVKLMEVRYPSGSAFKFLKKVKWLQ